MRVPKMISALSRSFSTRRCIIPKSTRLWNIFCTLEASWVHVYECDTNQILAFLGGLMEKSKPFDPCGVKIDNGWEALNNSETK